MNRPARSHLIPTLLASLSLLSFVPSASAYLVLDFADGAASSTDHNTSDDPFGNSINLRVSTGSATYNGSITGTGELFKTGAGTLLMTGTYGEQGVTSFREGKAVLTGKITNTVSIAAGWQDTSGELLVQSGASITSGAVYVAPLINDGRASGTGTITVDGPTTTWSVVQKVVNGTTLGGFVRIGDNNTGTLTIQSGAQMNSEWGVLGYRTGVAGIATVTGANSRWINSANMTIGYGGVGSLTVANGGRVEDTFGRLGEQVGTSGTAVVTGAGSTWASSGDIYVGNGGAGTLTVSNGGTVTSVGDAPLADTVGSTGTVNVTGAGSTWTNSGIVRVGNRGTGVLSIANGGKVTASSAVVANVAGSTGTLQLDGGSSQGVLEVGQLLAGSGTAHFNWNGGILRATQSRSDFLSGFGAETINVQDGGAYLDSNGFDIGSNASLIGLGGFVKTGLGTFTYTGTSGLWNIASVNGGTLTVGAGGSWFSTGVGVGRQAGTTGTLHVTGALYGGSFITVGDGLGSNGTLTVDGGGIVSMVPGAKLTVGWQNATGTLNLNAGGTIEVGGSDGLQKHATGTTAVNFGGGTLRVVNSGLTSSVPIALTTGSSTVDTNGLDTTLSGGLSGTGGLIKSGAGTLTLNAASSYSGGTQVDGGTLRAALASALGTNRKFVVNSGTLDANGSSAVFGELSGSGGTVYMGAGSLVINQDTMTTFGGGITSNGNLTKSGTGSLAITGSSNIAGITSANGGEFKVGAGGTYTTGGLGVGRQAGTTGTVRVTGAGAVLDAGSFITVGDGSLSNGTLTVDGGGIVRSASGAKLTVGWQNATGTLNLNSGGTIEVGGVDGLQKHATGTSTINFGGGTLRVVDSAFSTALPITLVSGNSTINTNGFDATLNSELSGGGGLIKSGSGTLTLNAIPSYTGGTQLTGGTLRAGVQGAFGTNKNFTVDAGVLDANGFDVQIGQLSGNGGTVSFGTNSLTVDQSTNTIFKGSISGSGTFEKLGAGILWLRGTSSFGGTTEANGGTLSIGSGGNFTAPSLAVGHMAGSTAVLSVGETGRGALPAVLTASDALRVGDGLNSSGTLTVNSMGRLSMGSGAKLTVGSAGAAGTLNLSGTVEIGGADGLRKDPTGTSIVNLNGGTFRVVHEDLTTSLDITAGNFSGSTFDTNGFNATLSGSVTGAGASSYLNKTGNGNLILNGGVATNGLIAVKGGGLEIHGQTASNGLGVGRQDNSTANALVSGNGAVLNAGSFATVGDNPGSTGTLTVENGGLFKLNSGAKLTVGWANATGTLNLNPGGIVEIGGTDGLQADVTGTSHINFAGGTFRVANANLTTSLPMTISGTTSTVDTNGFEAMLSGTLSGDGLLKKTGAGKLTLIATNGYTGGTTVEGGSLVVNGAIASVRVKNGGLLGGLGTVGDIMLDGGSLAPGASAGTLTGTSLHWLDGPIVFDLGVDAASSDLLELSGALAGTGDAFHFSFVANGWQAGQTYDLIHFGSSDIPVSKFAFTNTDGLDGTFAYDGNSLKFTLAVVPEPSTAALVSISLAAFGLSRRRRAA